MSNGVIDTSTGYGDVKPWPGGSGGATSAVTNAEDECILNYVDTMGGDARHLSATKDGDIWVGSYGGDHYFQLIDGSTGAIVKSGTDTGGPFACGGYGGLVDGNGIVWSAVSGSYLMRWDPSQPTDPLPHTLAGTNPKCLPIPNYGLAIDSGGNVWASTLGEGKVRKVAPDGTVIGTFDQGNTYAQGLAVDANDHVWISSSLFTNVGNSYVAHMKNDGTLVGKVPLPLGGGPTGIAVDAAGKIWSANINSSNATRIDPAKGPLGLDGVTLLGEVDLTVDLPQSFPYNYSDMTGALLLGSTAPQGTWNVVQDGGAAGMAWGKIRWNTEAQGSVPAGTSILVEARAADSEAGLGGQAYAAVTNDTAFAITGRYLQVQVTLKPDAQGVSPVLSDLRVCSATVTCTTPQPAVATPPPPPAAAPAVQVTTQAPARAKLVVTKRGPLTATAGRTATYRITIRNASTTTASKVQLRDTLPSGMTLSRRSSGASFRSGTLTWSIGALRAGASKNVSVTVRIDKNVGGRRCNTATALASNAKTVSDKTCSRIRAVAGAVAPAVTG